MGTPPALLPDDPRLAIIRAKFPHMATRKLCEELGMREATVRLYAKRLDLKKSAESAHARHGKRFDIEDAIRAMYATHTVAAIAEQLGLAMNTVYARAGRMGLKRPERRAKPKPPPKPRAPSGASRWVDTEPRPGRPKTPAQLFAAAEPDFSQVQQFTRSETPPPRFAVTGPIPGGFLEDFQRRIRGRRPSEVERTTSGRWSEFAARSLHEGRAQEGAS